MKLTNEQWAHWDRLGWLHLPDIIDRGRRLALEAWVGEVGEWATKQGPGLHHFEQTERGPAVARSELFADDHARLGAFIRRGIIPKVLAQLFNEPAVLFKEKINYKHPGGGGFAPHQDASAYRFVDHHISVMVPIDPATEASGCLWFAPGHDRGLLETDGRGRIHPDVVSTLDWRPVEVLPGDLVFFDSYAPHRSDGNTTNKPRRLAYLTYNAASRGDFRKAYYDDKLAEFNREGETFGPNLDPAMSATGTGEERVRISINDDFLGKPVPAPVSGARRGR